MRHVLLFFSLFCGLSLFAQNDSGVLRLKVTDASGLGLKCAIELTSGANQFHSTYTTDDTGVLAVQQLPFGLYSLRITRKGFSTVVQSLEIRSSLPKELTATLTIAAPNTTVTVTDSDTLLDPHRAGTVERIGSEQIENRESSQPGRSLQDLVNQEPGWLYEGNAVLHPRGSEYQTQLVVDGVPLDDNRSPGLGPAIDAENIQSVTVYTAGFPAEYGRKLGGVIEVNTARDPRPGLHGELELSGGSFNTRDGHAQLQFGWGANTLTVSGDGGATDWYLNPPVTQNFTNQGTVGDFAIRFERDLDPNDRLGLSVRHEQSRFQVPNEQLQEAGGQLQNRGNDETIGILTFQHVFNPNLLGDLRLMARSLDADLTSNPASTPIVAAQSRNYDEQYAKAAITYHHGPNEWKAGLEADFATIDEAFRDQITNPSQFDPGTPASFRFAGSSPDREQAAFVQDTLRIGPWTASLGVRWDHYQLLVNQNAVSPRLGLARYFQPLGLVVHASYDRVFQTPAMENLLLSSSPQVAALNPQVLRLPVRPSLANFYEAGATKELAATMRAELNYFRRLASNYADDDLLLNTSISFPIAFRKASIYGAEAKLDLPTWRHLTGSVSYSYLVGFASLPVTGGLFLGADAGAALSQSSGKFPISQDQRNTLRARFRYEFTSRLSAAVGAEYGSGLPVEFSGSYADALAQYGQQIVDRVNFARGRVLPNLSIDISGAAELWRHEKKSLRLQADVENLNNRLNLINFAGLFSGNTVEPPRSYHLRLTMSF